MESMIVVTNFHIYFVHSLEVILNIHKFLSWSTYTDIDILDYQDKEHQEE